MELSHISQNLTLFRDLISCNANIYLWCYDGDYNLLESNCPYEAVLSTVFSVFGCKEYLYTYAEENTLPLSIGIPLGLQWLAAFYKENGDLKRIYAIGPVFSTELSISALFWAMDKSPELNISASWRQELSVAMEKTPTVNSMIWNQYAVMLHYCVTGEKIRVSDIQNKHDRILLPDGRQVKKDRHKTWIAEKNMLRAVREGDLNYRDALNRSSMLSSGVPIQAADLLRQAKDSVIVSITLCSRAAIEGGLSPEQAYTLGDSYIQAVEDTQNIVDIGAIHNAMFEEFVLRVRKLRANPKVSQKIRNCCDYIEVHTEEKLSIESLAEFVGYSKYYLSRKFKEEMGTSINDYIKIAKVERSKTLLLTTNHSIQEIADQLLFCSRSHFSETFREIVGCTPVEFREDKSKPQK